MRRDYNQPCFEFEGTIKDLVNKTIRLWNPINSVLKFSGVMCQVVAASNDYITVVISNKTFFLNTKDLLIQVLPEEKKEKKETGESENIDSKGVEDVDFQDNENIEDVDFHGENDIARSKDFQNRKTHHKKRIISKDAQKILKRIKGQGH